MKVKNFNYALALNTPLKIHPRLWETRWAAMMRPQRGEIVRQNKGFSDIESAKFHTRTQPQKQNKKKKKNQLSSYYIMDKVTFQYKYFKGGGRRFTASADSLLHNEQLAALCSAEPGNMSADWTAAQTCVDQKRELHGWVWKCCRTAPSARQSGWTVKQLQRVPSLE